MGWLKKKLKQAGKKLKKFFKSDVGKVIGTVALAVAGYYFLGPAAIPSAGQTAGQLGAETIRQTGAETIRQTGAETIRQAGVSGAAGSQAAAAGTGLSAANQFWGSAGVGGSGGAGSVTNLTNITGNTITPISNNPVASEVIGNVSNAVSNGEAVLADPSLVNATADALEVNNAVVSGEIGGITTVQGARDSQNLQNLRKGRALEAEYKSQNLTNLAEATKEDNLNLMAKVDMDKSVPPTSNVSSGYSARSATTGENLLDPTEFDKDLFDPQSYISESTGSANIEFDKDLFKPKDLETFDPEAYDRWYLGKRMAKEDRGGLRNLANLIPTGTSDYAAEVGVGVGGSLLTHAILGEEEAPSGSGAFIEYDKQEAPAASYVNTDLRTVYNMNGGRGLNFDSWKNQTVPLFGPQILNYQRG